MVGDFDFEFVMVLVSEFDLEFVLRHLYMSSIERIL